MKFERWSPVRCFSLLDYLSIFFFALVSVRLLLSLGSLQPKWYEMLLFDSASAMRHYPEAVMKCFMWLDHSEVSGDLWSHFLHHALKSVLFTEKAGISTTWSWVHRSHHWSGAENTIVPCHHLRCPFQDSFNFLTISIQSTTFYGFL